MENSDQAVKLSPLDNVKAKIELAKPALATSAAAGGTDSFVVKVIHLFIELLPDIIELFHSPKPAAPVAAAPVTATAPAVGD